MPEEVGACTQKSQLLIFAHCFGCISIDTTKQAADHICVQKRAVVTGKEACFQRTVIGRRCFRRRSQGDEGKRTWQKDAEASVGSRRHSTDSAQQSQLMEVSPTARCRARLTFADTQCPVLAAASLVLRPNRLTEQKAGRNAAV